MTNENTLKKKQIRLRISQNYHEEPIISRLVSVYGLTINIKAAMLGHNAVGDGWFDLELQGTELEIENAINYLQELKLQIWDDRSVSNW